jgi:hypothetical protein
VFVVWLFCDLFCLWPRCLIFVCGQRARSDHNTTNKNQTARPQTKQITKQPNNKHKQHKVGRARWPLRHAMHWIYNISNISRPLVGHQAVLQSVQYCKFVSLQPCKSFQYCKFVSLQPCKPFWSCKFTAYGVIACTLQPNGLLVGHPGVTCYPPMGGVSQPGVSQGIPEKPSKFKPAPHTPQND